MILGILFKIRTKLTSIAGPQVKATVPYDINVKKNLYNIKDFSEILKNKQ